MKNLIRLLVLAFMAYACQVDELVPLDDAPILQNNFSVSHGKNGSNNRSSREASKACGEVKTVTLWAGRNIDAGTVEIYNNEVSLFVVYTSSGSWTLEETHVYVGNQVPKNKPGIIIPGKFPFKSEHPGSTTVTYEIPLADLTECFLVYTHAELKDDSGAGEGAFGGDIAGPEPRWHFYAKYCVQECKSCKQETAWVDGLPYGREGATYVEYIREGFKRKVFNSQGTIVAHAHFSTMDAEGNVTIKFELVDGWSLTDDAEAIKIQGYDKVPKGVDPSPEQFTTYKGNEMPVTVPGYNFYGVHLDVELCDTCNCDPKSKDYKECLIKCEMEKKKKAEQAAAPAAPAAKQ